MVRVTDYDVKYGIDSDMGDGDEWPQILDKILESDIVLIGTPLWLGEKSSVATLVIERMYGSNSIKNEKGQAAFYNKVGGVIVTGNEDGAKHASASVLYGLSHIGFTIPPNVDAYWVGEAGQQDQVLLIEILIMKMNLPNNMCNGSHTIPFIWHVF